MDADPKERMGADPKERMDAEPKDVAKGAPATVIDVDRMVRRKAGVRSRPQAQTRRPRGAVARRRVARMAAHVLPTERFVTEPAREVPVLDSCDVLVVGAGPAGLSAAVAAARAGADTMLIERFGCFGGVITTVGMETLGWYRYEGTTDVEGIGIEMEKMAARMNPGQEKFAFNDSECLDAEMFKHVADKLVTDAGVRPLLHTWVVDAVMDGNKIKGVVTESKTGRTAILAKFVIDCSGDADVAFFAGASFRKNSPDDAMGMTSVFNASGVDSGKFRAHINEAPATYADWSSGEWKQETTGKEEGLFSPYLEKEFAAAQSDGIIPHNLGRDGKNTLGGTWSAISDQGEATNLNLVHMKGFDPLDNCDLTKAEITGRQQTKHALKALQHGVPGFEKAKLRNFGMTIGIRDSRKIVGVYDLTGHDVMGQARFSDSIGIFPEFVDGYNILVLPTSGRYFEVPLSCMISKDVSHLLVAGRCVAGDNTSHAAMRNMMACCVTGQGAGVAAAVALRLAAGGSKGPVGAKVDFTSEATVRAIQEELIRQGVRLH